MLEVVLRESPAAVPVQQAHVRELLGGGSEETVDGLRVELALQDLDHDAAEARLAQHGPDHVGRHAGLGEDAEELGHLTVGESGRKACHDG